MLLLLIKQKMILRMELCHVSSQTTGMDPITRRHVWDIIEDAKKGRAIILTTHSMEEADILSDRIGIMAKGRLRRIGTSIRLKSRFGTGFIANVSFIGNGNDSSPNGDQVVSSAKLEAVKQFFQTVRSKTIPDFSFLLSELIIIPYLISLNDSIWMSCRRRRINRFSLLLSLTIGKDS